MQHNILVDGDGIACISEYGLELVLRDEVPPKSFQVNVRWTAPEVISTVNKNKRFSVDDGKRADVYSFAMVTFEVRRPTVHRIASASPLLTPNPRS